MRLFHILGFTSLKYLHPVLVEGKVPKTYLDLGYRSPAHTGPFVHAQDFLIPNPEEERLPIFAPASGTIIALVQNNVRWGTAEEHKSFLNYLTVQVTGNPNQIGGEFYEIAHIDANSCPCKIGQQIKRGEVIAKTGLNGWMTSTDGFVDAHVHFMVGIWTRNTAFKSLMIRYGDS